MNRIYTNLDKDLAPSPSPKTTKKPDDVDESEKPSIDERICSLVQKRIDICQNLPADHWFQLAFVKPLQTMLPDEKFEGESVKTTSNNTKSSHSKPTTLESPHTIRKLEDHLGGELPETPKKASETSPDIAVSEDQHHHQPNLQMASETCTELIIRPDFKPDSPLQSILETTSTDQTTSDTSTSVSEDLNFVVEPISVAKPENSLKAALDTLANKPSNL